jgi:Flp pilus assembly pilin Flp
MSFPHFCFAFVHSLSNRTSAAITQLLTGHRQRIWPDDRGQDIAEYAVMLAVILVIVVGTLRLIGTNANTAFSSVASSLQ